MISPMLRKDVETAVLSHAVMEAGNDIIPKGLKGLHTEFVDTYGAVQNALALKLAMDLARVFDLSDGWPPESQDKASLLVLAALLSKPDVQARLEQDAESWFPGVADLGTIGDPPPGMVGEMLKSLETEGRMEAREDCRKAISDFLEVMKRLTVDASEEKVALGRVRDFRNKRLAHSLFDKEPDELPHYADLNLLLAVATEAAKHASMAVEGLNVDYDEHEGIHRENAEGYAFCVLSGLKETAKAQ